MNEKEHELVYAAILWWKARRPVKWDLSQHLENPTINVDADSADGRLARAVAKFLEP